MQRRPDAAELVREAWADGLRPPLQVGVVDWIEQHVRLERPVSDIEGPYRARRTPYVREILDCLAPHSPVERVAVMKGAQLGLTLAAHGWICYLIGNSPSNILCVMPTVDEAKNASKSKIDPLFACCDEVSKRVKPKRARDSGNTVMVKAFQGGFLFFVGANAGTGLRSRSGPWLICDEVDGYPYAVREEGDPVLLAERFTTTFPRRKHLYISTPKNAGTSRIERLFLEGDQSYFHVPCPLCGELQVLKFRDKKSGWRGLRWEGQVPDLRVWYQCAACDKPIEEVKKGWMLDSGVWRPTVARLSEKQRSFHLSSLYSPPGALSWASIATKFLATKTGTDSHDNETLRVFVNHVLGEVWEEKGDAPPWEDLYNRRERYRMGQVPMRGLVLTAGADVQRDRIEVEIVAWGPRLESWSVDYVVILGDTDTDGPWRKLEDLLSRPFRHENGADLKIRMMAVDSGHATQRVYGFARGRPPGQVIAIKGVDSLPVPVGSRPTHVDVKTRGGKVRRGAQLWSVGVSILKRELYGALRMRPPNNPRDQVPTGLCHFPEYGPDHFKGICSEQLVMRRNPRGYMQYHWEKTQERNEQLDARVYARAAAAILGIDRWGDGEWARIAAGMSPAQSSGNARSNAPRESRYGRLGIDRWRSRKRS